MIDMLKRNAEKSFNSAYRRKTQMSETQTLEPTEVAKPKVKTSKEEPTATVKKEKVITESKALNGLRQDYIKAVRAATREFAKAVEAELQHVDVGHPHYSGLKFASIRVNRVTFNMDELSKGKAARA